MWRWLEYRGVWTVCVQMDIETNEQLLPGTDQMSNEQ